MVEDTKIDSQTTSVVILVRSSHGTPRTAYDRRKLISDEQEARANVWGGKE
jgi:hypothetical protein